MPTGLPWSDPDSDPMGDWRELLAYSQSPRARKAAYEASRRRTKETWILGHRIYCFAEITQRTTDAGDLETRCTGCHQAMLEILAKSNPKPIRGLRPQRIYVDEAHTDDRTPDSRPGLLESLPLAPAPGLLDLCLEHPWLTLRPPMP